MTERNCKNCACYAEVLLSPLAPPQSQCLRNGPMPAQVQIERPRVDPKTRQPVVGKDLKPVTEKSVENMFLYAPTAPDKVCFDGWRPIGTLPGENWKFTPFVHALAPVMEQALKQAGVSKKTAEDFGLAILKGVIASVDDEKPVTP